MCILNIGFCLVFLDIKDLTDIVRKLNDRIAVLEKSGNTSVTKQAAAAPSHKAPASKPKVDDDDDGVDLFGSDSEVN